MSVKGRTKKKNNIWKSRAKISYNSVPKLQADRSTLVNILLSQSCHSYILHNSCPYSSLVHLDNNDDQMFLYKWCSLFERLLVVNLDHVNVSSTQLDMMRMHKDCDCLKKFQLDIFDILDHAFQKDLFPYNGLWDNHLLMTMYPQQMLLL